MNMKKSFSLFNLVAILVLALYSQVSNASTTTVTGTIQDPTGQAFANGNITAEFVPASNYPSGAYTSGGVSFNRTVTGTLDATGAFSIVVTDSLSIAPALTTWRFKVCPNATSPCASYFAPVGTITGAGPLSLTTQINAIVPTIVVNVSPNYIPAAYKNDEIVSPQAGASFWDLNNKCIKVYDSATAVWTCTSLSSTIAVANSFLGAPDLCAQVNAADTYLGSNYGEVWLFAGGNFGSQCIISSHHKFRMFAGFYTNALGEYIPPILLKDNSELECSGWETVIQNSTNVLNVENNIVSAYNATVGGSGGGIPNNSRATSAGLSVKNCHFTDSGASIGSSLTGQVAFVNCTNCKVLDNFFDGAHGTHVTLVGSSNPGGNFGAIDEISGNHSYGAKDAAISVINNASVLIHHNFFHGHGNGAAAFIDLEGNLASDHMQYIDAHDNIMDMSDAVTSVYGITCNSGGGNQYQIKLHDNIMYGLNTGANHFIQGIACGASGTPNSYSDVEIYNNQIYYTVQSALSVGGMPRAFIHDNRILCGGGPAIDIQNNTFDSVIQNNIISAPLTPTCSASVSNYRVLTIGAIQEEVGADRNVFKGNVASRVILSGANSKVDSNTIVAGSGKTERVPAGFTSVAGAIKLTQLSPPTLSITTGAIGSCILAADNYAWRVTALDSNGGESTVSNQVTQNAGGGFGCANIYWTFVPGAVSYNIYRSTVAAPPELLIDNVSNYSLNYADLGGQVPGATFPATNNTGSVKMVEGGVIGGSANNDLLWADAIGHCLKFNANNAGNSGCIPGVDIAQNWTGAQTFPNVVSIAVTGAASAATVRIGTDSLMSNGPRMPWGVFLPGNLTALWTAGQFTPKKDVTLVFTEVVAKTAPVGCGTNAVIRITDGTNNVDLTLNAAIVTSNTSQAFANAVAIQVKVITAAAACGTNPADVNVTTQFKMQ